MIINKKSIIKKVMMNNKKTIKIKMKMSMSLKKYSNNLNSNNNKIIIIIIIIINLIIIIIKIIIMMIIIIFLIIKIIKKINPKFKLFKKNHKPTPLIILIIKINNKIKIIIC